LSPAPTVVGGSVVVEGFVVGSSVVVDGWVDVGWFVGNIGEIILTLYTPRYGSGPCQAKLSLLVMEYAQIM